MNELNAVGPENQGEARRYGAQSPLVHTMATDLFPTVSWDFATMDPEKLALQGARMRAATFQTAAAVAARFSAVGVANPLASGVLAVLESVWIRKGTAGQVRLIRQGLAVSALQGSTLGTALDSRITELASVRLLATDEAAVANYGVTLLELSVPANDSREIVWPHVLGPASTLWVVNQTANELVSVSARWRQRKIEDGEVSPV